MHASEPEFTVNSSVFSLDRRALTPCLFGSSYAPSLRVIWELSEKVWNPLVILETGRRFSSCFPGSLLPMLLAVAAPAVRWSGSHFCKCTPVFLPFCQACPLLFPFSGPLSAFGASLPAVSFHRLPVHLLAAVYFGLLLFLLFSSAFPPQWVACGFPVN